MEDEVTFKVCVCAGTKEPDASQCTTTVVTKRRGVYLYAWFGVSFVETCVFYVDVASVAASDERTPLSVSFVKSDDTTETKTAHLVVDANNDVARAIKLEVADMIRHNAIARPH